MTDTNNPGVDVRSSVELSRQPSSVMSIDQPDITSKALSGLELLRERVKANGDLSGRLREIETSVNDLRRQSTSIPEINPQIRDAIKKVNERVAKVEAINADLLAALSDINRRVNDTTRLISGFADISNGI